MKDSFWSTLPDLPRASSVSTSALQKGPPDHSPEGTTSSPIPSSCFLSSQHPGPPDLFLFGYPFMVYVSLPQSKSRRAGTSLSTRPDCLLRAWHFLCLSQVQRRCSQGSLRLLHSAHSGKHGPLAQGRGMV